MSTFFSTARFGRPQLVAALLLAAFLGQALWLARRASRSVEADPGLGDRIQAGLRLWRGQGSGRKVDSPDVTAAVVAAEPDAYGTNPGDRRHRSRVFYLIASFPLLVWPGPLQAETMPYWGWLARMPSLMFGLLLGGSLWYVAHRLYGDAGGYMALTFYCFSPGMIRASAGWFAPPETGAAWGAFGVVFTSIAVAHTLYAPREVILWNWRRILLLGTALALAVGSEFSLIVLVPSALAFLFYLAPERRGAAIAIWAAACGVAFALIVAAYFFRPAELWQGLRQAEFGGMHWRALAMAGSYRQTLSALNQQCPALPLAFPVALTAYAMWPRARYFGNTSPLLVAALLLVLGLGHPHSPSAAYALLAAPFLFLFVAGVFSDLVETGRRSLVLACVCGLLGAYAAWSLMELARVRGT